jgi:hypothetical protein
MYFLFLPILPSQIDLESVPNITLSYPLLTILSPVHDANNGKQAPTQGFLSAEFAFWCPNGELRQAIP